MDTWVDAMILASAEQNIIRIEEIREKLATLRDARRTDGELFVGLTQIIAGLYFVKESL
jgi:hypothetical protein